MSLGTVYYSSDLVSFCKQSLDPIAMGQLIQRDKGVGLSDPNLEEHLQKGDYGYVLERIWGEQDLAARLVWLEDKCRALHPPLMFELGIAKFQAVPKIETVYQVSIPLIKAAVFRVCQDAQCSPDLSIKEGGAAGSMLGTYGDRLHREIQAVLKRSLRDIQAENREACLLATKRKLCAVVEESLSKELPSPDWIRWSGADIATNGVPKMYPAEEYKTIRDKFASKLLTGLGSM